MPILEEIMKDFAKSKFKERVGRSKSYYTFAGAKKKKKKKENKPPTYGLMNRNQKKLLKKIEGEY